MTTFFQSARRNVWPIVAFVFVLYTIIAWLTDNTDLLVVMRSLQIGVAAAMVWLLWGAFRLIWRDSDNVDEDHVATTGQIMLWSAVLINATWLYLWRVADEPRWMVDSALNGFLVLLTILAGIFQLAAPGARHGVFPQRAARTLIWAIGISVVVSVVAFVFTDHITAFAEAMRPYLGETDPPGGWLEEFNGSKRQ